MQENIRLMCQKYELRLPCRNHCQIKSEDSVKIVLLKSSQIRPQFPLSKARVLYCMLFQYHRLLLVLK